MANAINFRPGAGIVGSGRTYTTDARDERIDTDPSYVLTMREVTNLRWFWTQCEADLGIRSTFGAQLEGALGQCISDDAAADERAWKRLVTRLRKGWRPTKTAKAAKRHAPITKAFLEHVEISLDADVDANYQRTRIDPDRLDAGDLSEQRIYMRAPVRPTPRDPYENDRVLMSVRKACDVRARLVRVDDTALVTLYATYGDSRYGEDRAALHKRYGELLGIAVALVATHRKQDDPPARAVLRAKLSDDLFVRKTKNEAGSLLKRACEAYARTRS